MGKFRASLSHEFAEIPPVSRYQGLETKHHHIQCCRGCLSQRLGQAVAWWPVFPGSSLCLRIVKQMKVASCLVERKLEEDILAVWWFGTWIVCFHILGISSSQLTNSIICQRGRSTTNQLAVRSVLFYHLLCRRCVGQIHPTISIKIFHIFHIADHRSIFKWVVFSIISIVFFGSCPKSLSSFPWVLTQSYMDTLIL